MWSRNALTEKLSLKWPILQAPMGWLSTPALAAAVSNAGGLGGLGMWGFSAEDAERRIAGFRQQSSGSLNVNYNDDAPSYLPMAIIVAVLLAGIVIFGSLSDKPNTQLDRTLTVPRSQTQPGDRPSCAPVRT